MQPKRFMAGARRTSDKVSFSSRWGLTAFKLGGGSLFWISENDTETRPKQNKNEMASSQK